MSNEQLEELPVEGDSSNQPICTFSNVTDPRMLCKSQLDFSIIKGGMNLTNYSEKASSASPSGLNFNVNIPTMSTIVDRVIYLRSTLSFSVTGAPGDTKRILKDGGPTLAPFPFQSMCSTIQMTVNNQSFSWNAKDTIGMITRMMDDDVLEKYGTLCPTQLDKYQSYNSIADDDIVNNPFAFYNTYNGGNPSRRSFLNYKVAPTDTTDPEAVGASGASTSTFSIDIIEPLIISPLLLQSYESGNTQGLYGINNLKFQFNIDSGKNRAIRFQNVPSGKEFVVSLSSVSVDTYLDFTFITPPASVSKNLVSRNIVPYMDLNLQKSNCGTLAGTAGVAVANTITTQSFQLSVIPDKVMVCVRMKPELQTSGDADSALPITGVQINFANRNGILSGTQPHQLCQMSIESGVNTNWLEFSGTSQLVGTSYGGSVPVNTCGSFLCLEFAKHINLTEDYYSAGSLGQFQFYMTLNVLNNTGQNLVNNYEVALLFMNSGFLINELGSSSVVVGVLTKDQVLTTSNEPPVNWDSNRRMIGGAWYSGLKSAWRKAKKYVKPVAKVAKVATGLIPHPYAQMTSKALGAMGAGYSAGASLRDRLM
jgi:hypothetical protein